MAKNSANIFLLLFWLWCVNCSEDLVFGMSNKYTQVNCVRLCFRRSENKKSSAYTMHSYTGIRPKIGKKAEEDDGSSEKARGNQFSTDINLMIRKKNIRSFCRTFFVRIVRCRNECMANWVLPALLLMDCFEEVLTHRCVNKQIFSSF